VTFERWRRLTCWLPPWVRCWVFHRLPRRLQKQAWSALADEIEAERSANDRTIAKQRAIAEESGFSHISELVIREFERLKDDAA
jgi:hypothetical protein